MILDSDTMQTITPMDTDDHRARGGNLSCFSGGWSSGFSNSDERVSSSLFQFQPEMNQNSAPTGDTAETKETVDSFMASSMAALSFGDRQKYQEELHGVVSSKPEDPEQISAWLQELHTFLMEHKPKGSAYETAETMSSDYVQDYKFRLMFLRGNRYKPKEAAQQMISFFEMKKRLFGAEKLAKDITLKDLDEDDKAVLQAGNLRHLPCYDSAGRAIILGLPGLLDVNKLENDLRARFYFFMNVLQRDERTQLNGLVGVSYAVGRYRDTSRGKGFVDQTKLSLALPIHFAGMHLCSNDPVQYVLISAALKMIPSQIRARFRFHMGSDIECQYSLKPFGIPPEALPSPSNTGFDKEKEPDYHTRWIKECEWREAMADGQGRNISELPIEPFPVDVLFGGRKNSNGGNRRLRTLVRNRASQYEAAGKEEKRELLEQVIHGIRQTGGRFLNLGAGEPEHWVELGLEDACAKVAQAFRNNRRPRATSGPMATGEGISSLSFGSMYENAPPDQPTENDVLFGRKRNNVGNKRVRQLVGDLATEYDQASKARKTQLADAVVQEIQKKGGRFLKQKDGDSSKWEEVPDEFARNKISKHFRNNRRPPTTKL